MKLKGFNKPLEQISRRILEVSSSNGDTIYSAEFFDQDPERETSPILQYPMREAKQNHEKITLKGEIVFSSRKLGDQWFLTHSGLIVKFTHATQIDGVYSLYGYSLLQTDSFFTRPIVSTELSIYQSNGAVSGELTRYDTHEISAKLMCLESGPQFVYIPILHTLDQFAN